MPNIEIFDPVDWLNGILQPRIRRVIDRCEICGIHFKLFVHVNLTVILWAIVFTIICGLAFFIITSVPKKPYGTYMFVEMKHFQLDDRSAFRGCDWIDIIGE